MPIFDVRNETLSRDLLNQLQLERLQAALNRAQRNVAWYRDALAEAGVSVEDVRALDDLRRLPMMTGETLIRAYPYGLFAVPLREIIRLHSVMGPAGETVVTGYTRNDVSQWTRLAARTLAAAGVSETDVVQIGFAQGFFAEAMGFQFGAELLGASVIPTPARDVGEQIRMLRDYRATVLVTTPTHARQVLTALRAQKIEPQSLHLRTCMLSRPVPGEQQREALEQGLFAKVFMAFGLGEIFGPGVAAECRESEGLHINEDHVLVEMLEPESDEPVPEGHRGELVLTTLTREGYPLLRYRTGYLTAIWRCACSCGRNGAMLQSILGRTDDRLLVNEVPVYPAQIETILAEVEHVTPHFRLNLREKAEGDVLEVQVGVDEHVFGDKVRMLEALRSQTQDAIGRRLGVEADVKLVEASTLKTQPRLN